MVDATVIRPNLNGMPYLEGCLSSLERQTVKNFDVLLLDNGSEDGSPEYVRDHFPQVRLHRYTDNTGFCHAVNAGIRMSDAPYVILLNNDIVCDERLVEELLKGIKEHQNSFSGQAKMLQMKKPELLDDGGDYYCALGWAFAVGKGKKDRGRGKDKKIFSSCGGAAIYRRKALEQIGLFDEKHFAYLEDVDLGYRARIAGYENWYLPKAVVYHAGSATSGSAYNEFKVRHTSRNSVYLIMKNMPWPQILLNFPFLMAGYVIKMVFFARKGFFRQYVTGIRKGIFLAQKEDKVVFEKKNFKNYVKIQMELWFNMIRRIGDF